MKKQYNNQHPAQIKWAKYMQIKLKIPQTDLLKSVELAYWVKLGWCIVRVWPLSWSAISQYWELVSLVKQTLTSDPNLFDCSFPNQSSGLSFFIFWQTVFESKRLISLILFFLWTWFPKTLNKNNIHVHPHLKMVSFSKNISWKKAPKTDNQTNLHSKSKNRFWKLKPNRTQ